MVSKERLKGKNWYAITAPNLFGEKQIGEVLAVDSSMLTGRRIAVSLMLLTGDPTRYYMKLFFKVNKIEGTTARTIFDGHECTRDFTSRIVQVRTGRIDANDVVQLKDGKMRVKTLIITNRQVRTNVEKAIRVRVQELVKQQAENKTIDEFVQSFIGGIFQNGVRADINKLYPLRSFEIRMTKVL